MGGVGGERAKSGGAGGRVGEQAEKNKKKQDFGVEEVCTPCSTTAGWPGIFLGKLDTSPITRGHTREVPGSAFFLCQYQTLAVV